MYLAIISTEVGQSRIAKGQTRAAAPSPSWREHMNHANPIERFIWRRSSVSNLKSTKFNKNMLIQLHFFQNFPGGDIPGPRLVLFPTIGLTSTLGYPLRPNG